MEAGFATHVGASALRRWTTASIGARGVVTGYYLKKKDASKNRPKNDVVRKRNDVRVRTHAQYDSEKSLVLEGSTERKISSCQTEPPSPGWGIRGLVARWTEDRAVYGKDLKDLRSRLRHDSGVLHCVNCAGSVRIDLARIETEIRARQALARDFAGSVFGPPDFGGGSVCKGCAGVLCGSCRVARTGFSSSRATATSPSTFM